MKGKLLFIFLFGLMLNVFAQFDSQLFNATKSEKVVELTGSINVVLLDRNNTKVLVGNKINRYDQSYNFIDTKLTDSNGQVSWTNISEGNYYFKGYNTTLSSFWGDDVFWGSTQGIVTSGVTSTLNIIQSEPYIESIKINGTVFGPGSTVHVDVTVKNPDSVAKTCNAEIRIDMDKMTSYDFESGFQSPLTIQPGQKSVFGFDWTIPLNTLPGTFYVASSVQALYENGYSITDATNWDYSIKNEDSAISQIQWSGYTWNIKSGSRLGPGPNNWFANTSGVWVDGDGNLHLKIRKMGEKWYCSEISTKPLLGYGNYTFQISSNVETLDKNIVLGLFTYETDTREIDIEFTRWGDLLNPVGWYNVQPTSTSNHHSFALDLSGSYSTHKFRWSRSEIFFQSYNGHYAYLPKKEFLISEWIYTGAQIPPAGNERIILNLWLYKGIPPSDLKEAEVIIKSFTFSPIIAPLANFSASPISGCTPLTVNFTDESTNEPTSWAWDIDNNGTIDYTTKNPTHTYNSAGTYSVKLTATNPSGSDTKILNNYITVNPTLLPGVTITALPSTTVSSGQLVTFTANPTNGGTNPKYEWKINGEITGSNSQVYSTSSLTNGQIVTCVMTSNLPCVSSTLAISNAITITVSEPNQTPVANAGVNQSVNEGTLVSLVGSASSDPDYNSLTFLWTAPEKITLSSNTSSEPTFTAPEVKQDTILILLLTVNDGFINSLPSSVKISVKNVLKTPTELLPENELNIYPNPTTGIIRIVGMQPNKKTKIEIYTIDGKLIMNRISDSTTCEIDISKLISGTFLVLVNRKSIEIIKE